VPDYRELLADPEVEAVYVPLPPSLHAEWVTAALEAGKHVLVEKPLTTGHRGTAALAELSARTGRVLMEDYMFVHHPQHQYVRSLVAEGAVGELRTFRASFTIPERRPDDFRLRPDLGGGALLDAAGYPVRAAQFFLGDDLTVLGACLKASPAHGVDIAGDALLRSADGVTAHIGFGMEHYYAACYELCGSAGRITVEHAFSTPPDHRPVVLLDRGGRREQHVRPLADQCANTLVRFADAVRRNADTGLATSVAQAAVLDAVRRAATAHA
jgi:predicted dehydrogenase